MNTNELKNMDIDKVAQAIEADAGMSLDGLRESLAQAKAGVFAQTHTPAEIKKRGRPLGGKQKTPTKRRNTLYLSAEVEDAFRATGAGWQTRMNGALQDWLKTHRPEEISAR